MSVTPAVPAPDSDAERRAVELRGFGLASLGFTLLITLTSGIVIPPMIALNLGGLFVLLWRQASRTPWREIGYVRPRSWPLTIAGGIVFGVAFKLLMKAIVMPLLGADPVNHAYHVLAGNLAIIPAALWTLTTVGFNEETVWRGYYFERLGKLWGTSAWAKAATVLVTSFFFALAHFQDQGLAGAEQAAITGLAFGTIYAITGTLPFLMIAHSAFDLTALAIIFWKLETMVAHFVFK
jgi:membrane protease YdiL (CAAX protease family)